MASESENVLREIREMHGRIKEANHYEVLGIKREEFDAGQLGGIYRNLAKKWHVDRFSQVDLGEDRGKVQEIFSAINQANRILSNEEQRKAYDEELDVGEGLDVTALLEADSLYLRGKNILAQGGYKGALDMFTEANRLNPDDQGIQIHKLYTEYLLIPKSEDGKPLKITRAQEIYDQLDTFHESQEDNDWLKVFLGVVAEGVGKERRALYLYREALMINPNNRDAQRQKRIYEMRKEKEANKGLLDKIKDFFKK